MYVYGGAWQRRSARPGWWQLPCGLRCRARLHGCIAPSATRIRIWGAFQRRSSTTRSTWRFQRRWETGRGVGAAYGNLCIAYKSQGHFSKAIKYHGQCLAIANEVGDRGRGRAWRMKTSASRISRRGASARPLSTTRRTWRLQRRGATGRGRAGRKQTSGAHISRRGTLARLLSTHAAPGDCKGGGRPGGGGHGVREPRVRV
jgi:hypothetical protein